MVETMYPIRLSACVFVLFVAFVGARGQSGDGWNVDDEGSTYDYYEPQPRPKAMTRIIVNNYTPTPRPLPCPDVVGIVKEPDSESRRKEKHIALIESLKEVIIRATSGGSYDVRFIGEHLRAGPSDYRPTPSDLPEPASTIICPPGFKYVKQAKSCYNIVYEEHNWTSAEQRCHDLHPKAHLVAIRNRYENRDLKTYLRKELARNSQATVCQHKSLGKLFWTSGRQMNETNCKERFVWKISDNKKLPTSFIHWRPKEPNCSGNNAHCIHITPGRVQNFLWNTVSCSEMLCPLCESKPL